MTAKQAPAPQQVVTTAPPRTGRAGQIAREEARELADADARWRELRPDHSKRVGGYYKSSNGIPIDSEGRVIPEAEWKEEDAADVRKRYPDLPVEKLPLFKAGGSDIFVPDGQKLPGAVQGVPLRGIQPRPEGQ